MIDGCIGITLSVCPPIRPSARPSVRLFVRLSIHPFVCPSACANLPVHIFLIETHWTFLLHTKIAYVLMVCNNFHPMVFGQVQGNFNRKNENFISGLYLSIFGHLSNFRVTCREKCLICLWTVPFF